MKKFTRREKRILKALSLVLVVALVMEVHSRYSDSKAETIQHIAAQQERLATFLQKLEGPSADEIQNKASQLEEEIAKYREQILELPTETDASLVIRQTIAERADSANVVINSISNRRSVMLNEETGMQEMKTYFAFDCDLDSLLLFFQALQEVDYYLEVETVSISARRIIRRRPRRPTEEDKNRQLNGNAVLSTLFLAKADASMDRYLDANKSAKATERLKKLEQEPPPVDESEFADEELGQEEVAMISRDKFNKSGNGKKTKSDPLAKPLSGVKPVQEEPEARVREPVNSQDQNPESQPERELPERFDGPPADQDPPPVDNSNNEAPQPATATIPIPQPLRDDQNPANSAAPTPLPEVPATEYKPPLEPEPEPLSGTARRRGANGRGFNPY